MIRDMDHFLEMEANGNQFELRGPYSTNWHKVEVAAMNVGDIKAAIKNKYLRSKQVKS